MRAASIARSCLSSSSSTWCYVLAISQLTHHLVEHLTWRGAAETLIALVAICTVWTFTTFEVALLDVEKPGTKATTILVMGLGLFMNGGITHAFGDTPWLFTVPMLLAIFGPGIYAAATAPARRLRKHYFRVVLWVSVSTPLWVAGALLDSDSRLWLWAIAATIDLIGAWTAHPGPGEATETKRVPFDAEHMLERMRLFIIILLGETVLALGLIISDHSDARTLLMALGCFVALVCLWAVYFGRAEEVVVEHMAGTDNPIRAVRRGINVIYGVVAGLVLFAVGTELMLEDAYTSNSGVPGILVLVGPMIYLLAQAFYFRVETGGGWVQRVRGAAVLGAASVAAYWLPPYGVIAALVVINVALATHLATSHGTPSKAEIESSD